MALSFIYVFVVSLAIWASAQNDVTSDFAKEIRNELPNETYEKIFATNINSDDAVGEVDKANIRAIRVFENILGVPLDQSTIQRIRKQARRLAEELQINPELVYRAYTATIAMSLEQAGFLNEENVSELAQQFAKELIKAAESLSYDDSYETTLPALTRAFANVFKSLGLNTKNFVELEQNILANVLESA